MQQDRAPGSTRRANQTARRSSFKQEERFFTPEHFERYQGAVRKPFEILAEASDFYVEVRDRDLQKAKARLEEACALIGANALHSVRYWTTTGREAGRGRGIHRFTVHHYRGEPCFVGCPNPKGRTAARDVPFDLNERAHLFVRQRAPEPKDHSKIFKFLALAFFLLAFGSLSVFSRSLGEPGFFAGMIAMAVCIVAAALLSPGYGTAPYSIKLKEGAVLQEEHHEL